MVQDGSARVRPQVRAAAGTVVAALLAAAAISLAAAAEDSLPFAFENVAVRAGLTATTVFGGREQNRYLLETTGCGAALFDYDSDGWLDAFLVNGTTLEAVELKQAARLNQKKVDRQAATFAVDLGKRRLGEGDVAGAVASLRDAIRLAPDMADAHFQLALALEKQGDAAEARQHFDEARRLAPYLRVPSPAAGRKASPGAPP